MQVGALCVCGGGGGVGRGWIRQRRGSGRWTCVCEAHVSSGSKYPEPRYVVSELSNHKFSLVKSEHVGESGDEVRLQGNAVRARCRPTASLSSVILLDKWLPDGARRSRLYDLHVRLPRTLDISPPPPSPPLLARCVLRY
jgi:hypothetical protein